MKVSLDTNVWIFGIVGVDAFCERIVRNLGKFNLIMPDQVREELERNLSDYDMKQLYWLLLRHGVTVDFEMVPVELITRFEAWGLKKGDAEIGAFREWRQIDLFVSDNRDFLRGLAPGHTFQVMSPQEFCKRFEL